MKQREYKLEQRNFLQKYRCGKHFPEFWKLLCVCCSRCQNKLRQMIWAFRFQIMNMWWSLQTSPYDHILERTLIMLFLAQWGRWWISLKREYKVATRFVILFLLKFDSVRTSGGSWFHRITSSNSKIHHCSDEIYSNNNELPVKLSHCTLNDSVSLSYCMDIFICLSINLCWFGLREKHFVNVMKMNVNIW